MSPRGPAQIESPGEFLLHSLELERESAEHYDQLAQSMAVHHNPEVAALFEQLARRSARRAEEIERRAQEIPLPELAPWEFKWHCPDPLQDCLEPKVHYLMTVTEALDIVLYNERRIQDFYAAFLSASDMRVRALAEEITRETRHHLNWLEAWRAERGILGEERMEDLDPPNTPE